MILERIRIENFRSFKDEVVEFDRYTCLVGPNGAGKSTVLTALNVFFRNNASTSTNVLSLGREDFHHCDTNTPAKITLTFGDLSPDAKADLQHYVRQDRLVVSAKATWSQASKSAEVKQFGSRMVMAAFAPYFAAADAGERAPKLSALYEEIRTSFPELPKATTGPARVVALRAYEEAHPEAAELVEDTAQFFGFTKGANLLTKYVQRVYIPAVKDASTEQEESGKTALGQLLERTIRTKVNFKEPITALKLELEAKYRELIAKEAGALTELQGSIEKRLQQWANLGARLQLGWHFDPAKTLVVNEPVARAAIGEGNFVGEVARLGHGLQRAFLVSILQELASSVVEGGPTLLLGFEEPELYQHPPQAQHMAAELEELASKKHNSQVIVCTHSPYFVSTKGFENVRMVRKQRGSNCSAVSSTTYLKISTIIQAAKNKAPALPSVMMMKLSQVMQPSQRELYFTRVAVMVEGIEDVAFVGSHLHLSDKWSNFRRLGCHFIVADGKNSLSRPLAIANEFKIPAFLIVDGDGDKPVGSQTVENSCLMKLCGLDEFDAEPKQTVWGKNHVVWPTCLGDEIREEITAAVWDQTEAEVCKEKGFLPRDKNYMVIAGVIDSLAENGITSKVLDKLCDNILAFAESSLH